MDTNNVKIRKRIIIGLVIGFVFLIFLFISLGGNGKRTLSAPFAGNINFAHQVDDKTLYYFSGSAFASYDLATHKTKPLTPLYSLPTIVDRVAISKRGAILSASGYSQVDQLYPEVVRKQLSPNGYYWWFVDFAKGTITLIGNSATGAEVRTALWQDDSTFVYTERRTSESILAVMRGTIGGTETQVATLPDDGAELLGVTATKLLYSDLAGNDMSNLRVLDIRSGKSTVVVKQVIDVLAVSTDGSALLITKGEQDFEPELPTGKLALYTLSSGETKVISPDFGGEAVWPYDGRWVAVGTNTKGALMSFANDNNKVQNTAFTDPSSKTLQVVERYQPIGQNTTGILLADSSARLRYVSKKTVTDLPKIPDLTSLAQGTTQPEFLMIYVPEALQYSVYITQNPYAANQQKAMNYFKKQGVDPYQLKIKWYAYDNVDTGFYLPPDVQPIEEPEFFAPDFFEAGD